MRTRKKIQSYSTMGARACVCVLQQTITQWSCQRRTDIIFFRICKIIIVLLLRDTCSYHCQVVLFVIFSLTTTRLCASPHIFWLAEIKETMVKKNFSEQQKCLFLVVLLTSFKTTETDLLMTLQFLVTDLNW